MTTQADVNTTSVKRADVTGIATRPSSRPDGTWRTTGRQGFSDRIVVAVAVDAAWPPTEGRYLNDAELDELYGNSG